jgi:competence protein ComEC
VLKVAHHGSPNGTAPEWIRATAPAIALLSLSSRNSYGHPSPGVEVAWMGIGARIYRTDRHGTIDLSATSDGAFTIRGTTSAGRPPR